MHLRHYIWKLPGILTTALAAIEEHSLLARVPMHVYHQPYFALLVEPLNVLLECIDFWM